MSFVFSLRLRVSAVNFRAGPRNQLQLAANPEYGTDVEVVEPVPFCNVTVIEPIAVSGPLTVNVWSSRNWLPVVTEAAF